MTARARYDIVRARQKAEASSWRSGFCNPSNPPKSHERCLGFNGRHDCVCSCHQPPTGAETVSGPVEVTPQASTRPPVGRRVTEHAVEVVSADDYRSPQWYAARQSTISASEVAAVLGLSPYGSPFDLWWLKRTGVDSQAESRRLTRGRRVESLILEDFRDAHPELTVTPCGLVVNDQRPWQASTPDGLAYDCGCVPDPDPDVIDACMCLIDREPVAVVEAKSDGDRDAWGAEGTDEIPVHYRCQVLWQLDTLGLQVAYLPVWLGGGDYREYVVERHEADVALMREAAEHFLDSVRENRMPEVDAHVATRRRLKKLHPSLTDDVVAVPATLVRQYQRAKATRDRAQDRMNLAENRVRALLGSAAKGEVELGDGRTKTFSHSIYEVAEHVRKASTTDRLNFPRKEI